MKILVATSNLHKIQEIRATVQLENLNWFNLGDLNDTPEAPDENGEDFRANALIKAEAYRRAVDYAVLSDDSGIVVPELDGEPGIHSARYSGPGATDESNRKKLLKRIQEKGLQNPKAYFVCVLCFYRPGEKIDFFEARWHGSITDREKGPNGFGYDPIFIPEGMSCSAAELDPEEKNRLSHRGQALQAFQQFLQRTEA